MNKTTNSKKIDITVTILTYNGEELIKDVLKSVFKQRIDKNYEVLIIDSGSTDKTLGIINKFPKVRLHQIPNSEFGHGKTRQLAAEMAKGEFVVYLTHDAIPASQHWLHEIIQPFSIGENIVGVMGKQKPRPNCVPLLKQEIINVFTNFGPDFGTTVFYKDSFIKTQSVYDAVSFYSDVNSAARRSALLGEVPYQDVNYAEDQVFGRDVIERGLYKVYAPRACVIHSNHIRLKEYRKRMFDETFGLRSVGVKVRPIKIRTIIKATIKGVIKDTFRILRDKDYSYKRKAYWLIVNPLFHIEKWRGVQKATGTKLNDKESVDRNSLERSRR